MKCLLIPSERLEFTDNSVHNQIFLSEGIMKTSKKKGMSPGSLVFIGEKKTEKMSVRIMDFNVENITEKITDNLTECCEFKDSPNISWLDFTGLHDVEKIGEIGKMFEIHPLVIEDILNTSQRPKIEIFDNYFFIVFKMLYFNAKISRIESEQVSLIVTKNKVLSFQEKEGDVFDPLRERIRKSKGRVKSMGSDYLAYEILDIIVDNYLEILETLGEQIEVLEEELMKNPGSKTLGKIYRLKREILMVRKSVWPLRDVVSKLERGDIDMIEKKTEIYIRDLYDHVVQVIDTVETFRDMSTGLLDLYLSSVSFKMNDIMKVLTIISTIFIPLTFIAGVYGMNFENMPELRSDYGYFVVIAGMLLVGIGMIFYFRKKKWI